jgi:hypothetical protein
MGPVLNSFIFCVSTGRRDRYATILWWHFVSTPAITQNIRNEKKFTNWPVSITTFVLMHILMGQFKG